MDSQMNETFLDNAAGEALMINSAADSQALAEMRPGSAGAGSRIERELNETVARLAAASPYMKPSADLRGRILQATAPASFRMEDYRRKGGEDMRFYKWGFYAAAVFLIAASMYNIYTRNTLTAAANQQMARANSLAQQVQMRDSLVSQMADPRTQQVTMVDASRQPVARVYLNPQTRQAVLIASEGLVPEGKSLQVRMPEGIAEVPYQTTVLTVRGGGLHSAPGQTLANVLSIGNMSPDESNRPMVAGMGH